MNGFLYCFTCFSLWCSWNSGSWKWS